MIVSSRKFCKWLVVFLFIYLFFILVSPSFVAPQCCMQGISKKLGNVSWLFVSPKFLVQNKLSRDVVVRSELTAAGSAEDGYLLPGMYNMFYLIRFCDLCLNCEAGLFYRAESGI